jgi:muramidase (phage lysozyme)
MNQAGILAMVAIATIVFWARDAQAIPFPDGAYGLDFDPLLNNWGLDWDWDDIPTTVSYPEDADMQALLYAIRRAEHFPGRVASGEDYRTFYGNTLFDSFADHPVLTGEKVGIRLKDEWCRAAGLGPGCVSTAAGAYQINVPTWRRIRTRAPYLMDFSPTSQDEAAMRLIRERGADRLIRAGRIADAFYALAPVWASLPRSTSSQPQKTIDAMLAYYAEGLSNLTQG